MKTLPTLLPSDVLLYGNNCWQDLVIYIKTYSDVGHVEVYEGDGMSSAARAEGVNLYPLRTDGLRYIYRPKTVGDIVAAKAWFYAHAMGDKYWFAGLLGFDWPANHPLKWWAKDMKDKWFCSMYATARLRASGIQPFNPSFPAEKVPPMLFKTSSELHCIYSYES
jgi:hypothetical protein